MGWRGTLRTVGAIARQMERDARRRQRALEQQAKQHARLSSEAAARYEVEVFENHIELITSIHREAAEAVDWRMPAHTPEPTAPRAPPAPVRSNHRAEAARSELAEYRPGCIANLFRLGAKRRLALAAAIPDAEVADESDFVQAVARREREVVAAVEQHRVALAEWREARDFARRILAGDADAMAEAVNELDPFSEIASLGSRARFRFAPGLVEVLVYVHDSDVVPATIKSLTKTGKLSEKAMPKARAAELYQDYVCGCVLRVARDSFAVLPVDTAIVSAVGTLLDAGTGHLRDVPIVSALIPRATVDRLDFERLDPSDSMVNFVHNMKLKKGQGFQAVPLVAGAALDPGAN